MPGSSENSEQQAYGLGESGKLNLTEKVRSNASFEDTHQLWQIALRDILNQVERHEYDSWLKNLSLLDLNSHSALIGAPTTYARRKVETEYNELVSRTLSGLVGYDLDVQFTVEAPVQGSLFDSHPNGNGNGNGNTNGMYASQQARPAPNPGIKSRGPYLNLNSQNGNGNGNSNGNGNRSRQTRGMNQSYSNPNFGIRNPQHYDARLRSSYDMNENGAAYNYAPEAAELDDPITNPPGGAGMEQLNDLATQFGLNPRYVFDKYIVGNNNRMAYAASQNVAENPGNSYNPLFIYGGVGLGKTHLLHAIGHQALKLRPYLKVLYVSSEKFTNDLINGIREQRMEEFRARYRTIDLLMIDDIQFIAGKDQTQEEFFHTFNTLVESNKQVVISSDRPPKSMLVLSDRLRSRFEGGLITDIGMPDYETRLAILQAKAAYQPTHIPPEVMDFIAHTVPSNIRELEGALIRVVAYGYLNKMPITVELATQALNDSHISSRKKMVTKERILEAVANFFNVEIKEIQGRSRSADIVLPRQIAMYLIREHTDHSLVEIGQSLGGRDHTTVMHGLEKIEQTIETNSQLRQQVNTITQIVYNGDNAK